MDDCPARLPLMSKPTSCMLKLVYGGIEIKKKVSFRYLPQKQGICLVLIWKYFKGYPAQGRKVLSAPSGQKKENKETWWWNEAVEESTSRKRVAKKK